MTNQPPQPEVRRHLRLGWSLVTLFAAGGLALEALHGFKVGDYLDVGNETRRLMWTLAHAHGALLGALHLAFAGTLYIAGENPRLRLGGRLLEAASLLLPAGFFLGGFQIRGGDPGVGILLVPPGGVLLILALGFAATGIAGPRKPERSTEPSELPPDA